MADRIVILSGRVASCWRARPRSWRRPAGVRRAIAFGAPAGLDTTSLAAALGAGVDGDGAHARSLPD